MTGRDQVRVELGQIRLKTKGRLYPAVVVEWARSHAASALHNQFDWDDRSAAAKYRLWQARQLIQVHMVDASGNPEMVSLTYDRGEGGGYRLIDDVLTSSQLSAIMLKDAIDELDRTQLKYRRVQELTSVWKALDRIKKKPRSRPRGGKKGPKGRGPKKRK